MCVCKGFTYKIDICDWHVIFIISWSLAGAPWAGHLAGPVCLHRHQPGTGGGFLKRAGGRWSCLSRWGGGGGCFGSWWRAADCRCSIRSLSIGYFTVKQGIWVCWQLMQTRTISSYIQWTNHELKRTWWTFESQTKSKHIIRICAFRLNFTLSLE